MQGFLTSLDSYRTALQTAEDNWNTNRTDPALRAAFEGAKISFRATEKNLLVESLKYLKGSNFKACDTIRLIIKEGVQSAQRGNPYLAFENDRFLRNRQELQ